MKATASALAILLCFLLASCPGSEQAGQPGGQQAGSQQHATSSSQPQPGGSIRLSLEVSAADLASTSVPLDDRRLHALARCIELPLVRCYGDGDLQSGLASGWNVTEAGQVWSFALKAAPGHEDDPDYLGKLLTQHFQRILRGEDSPLKAQLADLLAGAHEYSTGSTDSISGVKLASGTLTLRLTRANHFAGHWLSQPGFGLSPGTADAAPEQAHAAFAIGEIVSIETGFEDSPAAIDCITLVPNPDSLVDQPVVDELQFALLPGRSEDDIALQGRLFDAGLLDTCLAVMADTQGTPDAHRLQTAVPVVGQFDLHQFPWGDQNFQSKLGLRQALNISLDRELLEQPPAHFLRTSVHFFPPQFENYIDPQLVQQPAFPFLPDIEQARAGLRAADHADGIHLLPGMDLGYLAHEGMDEEVKTILRDWEQITVKMRPMPMTPEELALRVDPGTHEIVYRRLYPAYPSMDAITYPYLYGALLGTGGNYWNQAQPQVDKIIRQAQTQNTGTELTRSYRQLSRQLSDESLLVFIGSYTPVVRINEKLAGYSLTPYDFDATLPCQDFSKLGLAE